MLRVENAWLRWFPRTRGDRPEIIADFNAGLRVPPYTRG